MGIEPREIVQRFVAELPDAFKVFHVDGEAGVVMFNFNGLDNTVYVPAEAVLAAAEQMLP